VGFKAHRRFKSCPLRQKLIKKVPHRGALFIYILKLEIFNNSFIKSLSAKKKIRKNNQKWQQ
tara:strand:+ start:12544 stop:12729 length:186 start_codon:yes stop_codon:yes gene_type:complete